eukprot:TRINITY_DN5373_c0_g1_i2.p1 TRINITY_DN5373_c0_g1~~TRINITY_DN5373_c0_g1_i2.p1  ORF type:complete len:181 (-),score=20.74 TRINITY_DN5373_c0_g1_i2:10-552(-)
MQKNNVEFVLTKDSRDALQQDMAGGIRGYLYFDLNQAGVAERLTANGWAAVQQNYVSPSNIPVHPGAALPLPGVVWANPGAFNDWLQQYIVSFEGATQMGTSNLFSFHDQNAPGGASARNDVLRFVYNRWWLDIMPINNWLHGGEVMTAAGAVHFAGPIFKTVTVWTGKDMDAQFRLYTG